jgi:hypothetical protein
MTGERDAPRSQLDVEFLNEVVSSEWNRPRGRVKSHVLR